jgi:hypothetical protein
MKSTVIALTVAAALGAGSIPAFARDHGGDRQQQWHQRADQRFERHDRGGNWGHVAPRYYGHPQYRSYYYQPQAYYAPGYYAPGYYSYDDGADVIGGAILGALAGGLVGQLAAGR